MNSDISNGRLGIIQNFTLAALILGIAITAVNIFQLQKTLQDQNIAKFRSEMGTSLHKMGDELQKPKVWIHGKQVESGYLKHVFEVFGKLGFEIVTSRPDNSDWTILWTHEYPFTELHNHFDNLQPFQKVNHFPGCGFITNKVSLATSSLKHIPKAFKLPSHQNMFIEYAKLHPEKLWVQKSNSHRGIRVQRQASLDLDTEGTFLQEFVQNPLLIDGRKFDIGIYTTLTSIDPLRVYIYAGDVLLRFCMDLYHPFNESNIDSYVVGDDYLPIWKVPSLEKYYNHQALSMKESLNEHLKEQGKSPMLIWQNINEAIAEVYREKELSLVRSSARFKSTRNFFEMVRFDFVVDEELNVYLLEANMSPNLSSAHFRPNRLLYEQVVYNLLSLVGLAESVHPHQLPKENDGTEMPISGRDIAVFGESCSNEHCATCPLSARCKLCHHCLSTLEKEMIVSAYSEHLRKRACRRIFPPPLTPEAAERLVKTSSTLADPTANDIMAIWFAKKCLQDISWCH